MCDVVGPVGGEQQRLGPGRERLVVVQEQVADPAADGRGAGFMGDHERQRPVIAQRVGEQLDLGRLARPLAALERDEHAAVAHPPARGRVAAQRRLESRPDRRPACPSSILRIGKHAGGHREQRRPATRTKRVPSTVTLAPPMWNVCVPTCATTNGTAARPRISTTRISDCSNAKTRPRISSSTSVPISVMPDRYATPAPKPTPEDEDHRQRDLRHDRGEHKADAAEHDRQAEQPTPRQLAGDARTERHAGAEADEDRSEQHAVGRVAAAEAGDEDLAGTDHCAAGGERADQADDQSADQPGCLERSCAPSRTRPAGSGGRRPDGRPGVR